VSDVGASHRVIDDFNREGLGIEGALQQDASAFRRPTL
jgi:hypothetical protein